MDFSTDLLRVLWHELGHFCIEIIATDENKDYQIDRFYVSFHEAAISDEKWGGAIRTMPITKFDELINDPHKTAYAYISLISGCIFQTIFYNEIDEKELNFNSCFGLSKNCAGLGDLRKFNEIFSMYLQKYGNREKHVMYICRDLPQICEEHILENKNFLNQLNALAIRERDIILQEFNAAENKDDFYHHNDGGSIENLRNEVREILQNTGIYETIYSLKGQVCEAIEEDIKNGSKKIK